MIGRADVWSWRQGWRRTACPCFSSSFRGSQGVTTRGRGRGWRRTACLCWRALACDPSSGRTGRTWCCRGCWRTSCLNCCGRCLGGCLLGYAKRFCLDGNGGARICPRLAPWRLVQALCFSSSCAFGLRLASSYSTALRVIRMCCAALSRNPRMRDV